MQYDLCPNCRLYGSHETRTDGLCLECGIERDVAERELRALPRRGSELSRAMSFLLYMSRGRKLAHEEMRHYGLLDELGPHVYHQAMARARNALRDQFGLSPTALRLLLRERLSERAAYEYDYLLPPSEHEERVDAILARMP